MTSNDDTDVLEGVLEGHTWSARWTGPTGSDAAGPQISRWHVTVDGRMVFTRSSPMPFGDEPDPRPKDRQPYAAIERVVQEWLAKQ